MTKKSLHIFIQKNNGVGKSVASTSLAQVASLDGKKVRCFDLDQKFSTLMKFNICPTEQFAINPSSLDHIFNELVAETEEAIYIVDTHSSDYTKMNTQLTANDALKKLEKEGVGVYIHTIVVGGKSLMSSLQDLQDLISVYPYQDFVVWTNKYFGDVSVAGKDFKGMKAYENNSNIIKMVVNLEKPTDYMERDIKELYREYIPYNMVHSLDLPETKRNRMIRFYDHVFTQIRKEIFKK